MEAPDANFVQTLGGNASNRPFGLGSKSDETESKGIDGE